MGRLASLAVAIVATAGGPAWSDEAQSAFQVSLQVPVRLALQPVGEPARITVTERDLARGYVDVSANYHVSHNDRRGYLLQIVRLGGIAREVRVSGLGGTVVVAGDAVEMYRDGRVFEQDVALEFRLMLDEGVEPGTFGWPVALSAQPL